MEKGKFGSHWVAVEVIPLGGMWALAVGVIEDDNIPGDFKIRVAKGKIKGTVQNVLGELKVVGFEDKNDPITQISRVNFKTRAEWEKVKVACDKFFTMLEKGEVKHK